LDPDSNLIAFEESLSPSSEEEIKFNINIDEDENLF